MSFRWRFHPDRLEVQRSLARSLRLSEVAARVLVNRGFENPLAARRFLDASIEALHDPFAFRPMDAAVERLLRARRDQEKVLVFGDSDADGVCGAALLATALGVLGWRVEGRVPNRLTDGYSLSERHLARILDEGAAVVVTVDNGTTAGGAVNALRRRGIDVVVCDHHEAPGDAASPLAMLNPKHPDSGYPFPHLCGTAVAYQLFAALASRLPAPASRHDLLNGLFGDVLGLVAVATICDCVPLVGENRALVRTGLAALSETEHPGLRALLRVAGVGRTVRAEDVAFRIGPRLNAAGRLGQVEVAFELLLCRDPDAARLLARRLDDLNRERQEIEARILHDARRAALERVEAGDPVLVLHGKDWHAGVLGIVAARLAAEFERPAVLVGEAGGVGRGSGRTARGIDLHALISLCSSHLSSFGGHAAAAGFEIEPDRFDAFRRDLLEVCRRHPLATEPPELWIDAELPLGLVSPSLLHELDRLAPFGHGLPAPVFATPALTALETRVVGRNETHLLLELGQDGVRRKGIAFGLAHHSAPLSAGAPFRAAFTPRLNFFRGRLDVELEIRDLVLTEEEG